VLANLGIPAPDTTVGQLLSQSPCTPTTAVERRVVTSLVKCMLVQLSTGGQVILPKLGSKFQVHKIAVVRLFLLWPGNKARPRQIVCVKECPQLVHFKGGGLF